jgi:hypothetical protein
MPTYFFKYLKQKKKAFQLRYLLLKKFSGEQVGDFFSENRSSCIQISVVKKSIEILSNFERA